jgi:hypothetical protein
MKREKSPLLLSLLRLLTKGYKLSNPEEMIDFLILNGALEPSGIHEETGEILFSFTEKLEEVSPEIFNKLIDSFQLEILELWKKGFIEIDITAESPLVSLTEKSLNIDARLELSEYEQATLDSVIKAMRDHSGA